MAANYGAAASDLFSGLGGLISGNGQAAADEFNAEGDTKEAAAYRLAAGLSTENAAIQTASTGIQKTQTMRQIFLAGGTQVASLASNGFENGGSGGDILRSTAEQGAIQKQLVGTQGQIQENAYTQQANSYTGLAESADEAARAAQASANASRSGGVLKAVGGVVGALFSVFGCWVAREVYGQDDPRWIEFRTWLIVDAPIWFSKLYCQHGERFALFLRGKPVLKFIVRQAMNFCLWTSKVRMGHATSFRL